MKTFTVLLLAALCACVAYTATPVSANDISVDELASAMSVLASQVEELKTRLGKAEAKIAKLEGGAGAGAEGDVDESAVKVLDASNFDETVAASGLTLVEFYAPWCGHCKALKPEWAKAAKLVEGTHQVAKVDCTTEDNKALCSKYEVQGFPTIKLFRNDGSDAVDYNGERDADAITAWMIRQAKPAVTDLADSAAVTEFSKGEEVTVVAFLEESDADGEAAYRKAANTLRNSFSFGLSRSKAAAEEQGAALGNVVVIRKFDAPAVYTGDLAQVADFVKAESLPLLGTLTAENYRQYYDRGFPFVWVFVDVKSDEQDKMVEAVIAPVAKEQRATLSFVKMDGEKWAEHIEQMGAKGTPAIVIEDREKGKNYVFDQSTDVTSDAFRAWVASYLDGSLKPLLKSEEPPADNSGPVTVVVGKTFEEIVLDDAKDVLLEFYAPWCGHCKSLAPKYDELGKQFAENANVVIAKVDATANDTPADVKGFPTIFLYPAGDKANPVEYMGERTAEAMAEFIKENGKAGKAADKEL